MADKKPLVLTNGSIKEIGAGDTVPISNGGTGATTATAALNALLPSQTGNNTKVLGTDGTNTSWVAVSGANLTELTAGNLSGTIPSAVLGNSALFVGTTSIALNRASGNQALTGILSTTFAGSTSGTTVLIPTAIAGTTTITLPAVTGTIITTGDSGTVTNTMLAGSIANGKLSNNTISGISLGSNLATLTIGTGLSGTSYNGGTAVTIAVDGTVVTASSTTTFTNKTFDTAGTGNSFSINGVAATANTGTGAVVRAASPTLTTPALGTPSALVLTNATALPLTTGVTGVLPIANGGTNSSSGEGLLSGLSTAFIPKATGATTVANSIIHEGTNGIYVGGTNSATKFQVAGAIRIDGDGSDVAWYMYAALAIRNTLGTYIDTGTGGSGDLIFRTGSGFTTNLTLLNDGTGRVEYGLIFRPFTAPTPVSGMVYCDNSTNRLKFYDGTNWNTIALKEDEISISLSANQTSNTTTYADVTDFVVPVVGGKTYKIEIIAMFSSDTTTTGIKFGLYSAAAGGTIGGFFEASLGATALATGLKIPISILASTPQTTSQIITTGVTVINTKNYLTASIIFNCTVSGNIQFAMGSEVNSTTVTLSTGSTLIYKTI